VRERSNRAEKETNKNVARKLDGKTIPKSGSGERCVGRGREESVQCCLTALVYIWTHRGRS
jgi:hypothetical protein